MFLCALGLQEGAAESASLETAEQRLDPSRVQAALLSFCATVLPLTATHKPPCLHELPGKVIRVCVIHALGRCICEQEQMGWGDGRFLLQLGSPVHEPQWVRHLNSSASMAGGTPPASGAAARGTAPGGALQQQRSSCRACVSRRWAFRPAIGCCLDTTGVHVFLLDVRPKRLADAWAEIVAPRGPRSWSRPAGRFRSL